LVGEAFLELNDLLIDNDMDETLYAPVSIVVDSCDQTGDDSEGVVDQTQWSRIRKLR
jgi:hypothetical protein